MKNNNHKKPIQLANNDLAFEYRKEKYESRTDY